MLKLVKTNRRFIDKNRLGLFSAMLLTLVGLFSLVSTSLTVQADAINSTDFVITVKTDNPGVSAANEFTIPTLPSYMPYDYTVDCNNDGVHETTSQTGDYTCVYAEPGTYSLRIAGNFPRIYFNNTGDKLKLLELNQWGTNEWQNMAAAFFGAENMDVVATDTPNLNTVSDLTGLFRDAKSLVGSSANWNWNTSNVQSIDAAFRGAVLFNQPIGSWDTSRVFAMNDVFHDATSFNQPLDSWDTSNVIRMYAMFYNAVNFNQNLSSWSTGKVANIGMMFAGATNFNNGESPGNSTNPLTWNTSEVTNTYGTFRNAREFNQPINDWNTANVANMGYMFNGATKFNQNIGSWDTTNVTNMVSMFSGATVFNNGEAAGGSTAPLNWNTGNVVSMESVFNSASAFNQAIGTWDTGSVFTMLSMFRLASSFNQNISSWNISSVTSLQNMFSSATSFNNGQSPGESSAPLAWDVSNVESMPFMFQGATAFNQPLEAWDTSKVSAIQGVLRSATSFDQPLGGWDLSSVTDATYMLLDSTLSTPNYRHNSNHPGPNRHGSNRCQCIWSRQHWLCLYTTT